MKCLRIIFIFSFIMLYYFTAYSQQYHTVLGVQFRTKVDKWYNSQQQYTYYDPTTYDYGSERLQIPNTDPPVYADHYYHAVIRFDLSSIPIGSTNLTATLYAHEGSFSTGRARIVTAPDDLNFNYMLGCWNAAENGGYLFEITQDPYNYNASSIVAQKLSQRYINFGMKGVSDLGNTGTIDFHLTIYYDAPVTITTDNNFTSNIGDHGEMIISGFTGNQRVPKTFQRNSSSNLTLQAVSPQTDNQGYQELWYTGSSYHSEWQRNDVPQSQNNPLSFTVSSDDNGKTYKAIYRQLKVTTSGALSSSETWFTNVTLTGNVTVPSGVTLTLTSGSPPALFDLRTYSITSTGGTIVLQGNPIFITPLRAKVNSSGTLKGLFTSLQSAVNFASSGNEVVVQSGTFTENFSVVSKNNLTLHGIDATHSIINGTISLNSSSGLNIYNLY